MKRRIRTITSRQLTNPDAFGKITTTCYEKGLLGYREMSNDELDPVILARIELNESELRERPVRGIISYLSFKNRYL